MPIDTCKTISMVDGSAGFNKLLHKVYIHACTHAHTHSYIHTYMHTYIHTYIMFNFAYMRSFNSSLYLHAYMYVLYVCMHVYMCVATGHVQWRGVPSFPGNHSNSCGYFCRPLSMVYISTYTRAFMYIYAYMIHTVCVMICPMKLN
jgi:hypothetical protein